MSKPAILVTGSRGQLGNEFRFLSFTHPNFQFFFADVEEMNITSQKQVDKIFEKNKIDFCVNCAAYTAVDKAQTESRTAALINVTGARNLAKACEKVGARLIHISTDYVYHNNQNTPFKESDKTAPKSVYAKTKLRGEREAQKYCAATTILRTSWVYSTYGNNFVRTMLRLGAERPELGVVFDQIGTPTYARDLAQAILVMIDKIIRQNVTAEDANGIFHYSNEGVTSWYDFARAIFEAKTLSPRLNAIETSAYPTPAQRPPFSVLNKQKIKTVFGLQIPHWQDSLLKCLREM